nr:ABC transporter ATP-binding protein [Deinococcus sp. GbtcB9]
MTKVINMKENLGILSTVIRIFQDLYKTSRFYFLLLVAFSIIAGCVPAINLYIGKYILDIISKDGSKNIENIVILAIVWIFSAFIGHCCYVGQQVMQGYAADSYLLSMTKAMLDKMKSIPGMDMLEDPKFYDDIQVIRNGISEKPARIIYSTVAILMSGIGVIGFSIVLFKVFWWAPLILLVGFYPLAKTEMRLFELSWGVSIQNTMLSRKIAYDQSIITSHEHAKEIRLANMFDGIQSRFEQNAIEYQGNIRRSRNKLLLGVLPSQLLAFMASGFLFACTVRSAFMGQIEIGSVLIVLSALSIIRDDLLSLSDALGFSTEFVLWFKKYYNFIDSSSELKNPEIPLDLPKNLNLELRNVSFSYDESRKVIDDISIIIPYGQKVAIVGENGAGKSTFIKLLLRFYDPSEGSIKIFDQSCRVDLKDIDVNLWRSHISAVFQDFAKFKWSIEDNISLLSKIDNEKLIDSLIQADAKFIYNLPEKEKSIIGHLFGGTELSGGQWQKIAIARAVYKDAKIFIFDEPTSALDPKSEIEIFDKFLELSKNKTALMITHRLGSVKYADRIIVIKNGKIIEDGRHAELMVAKGEYYSMWNAQSRNYNNMEKI